jgi:hypothetical protein
MCFNAHGRGKLNAISLRAEVKRYTSAGKAWYHPMDEKQMDDVAALEPCGNSEPANTTHPSRSLLCEE